MSRCQPCRDFNCVSKADDILHLPAADWGKPLCHCTCHDEPVVPCKDCGTVGDHFCVGPQITRNIFEVIRAAIPPKCKKHRQYKALRRPRTACEPCWRQWIAKNP